MDRNDKNDERSKAAEKRKQAHRVRAWVRGVNRAVKLQGDLRRVAVARGLERAEAHVDQIAAG